MKYSILGLLALFLSFGTKAQTTIVIDTGVITITDTIHCFNHVLHAEVTGGIIPTPSGITVDDGWSGIIPIGFTYNFYGLPNTQCVIGSNGCLGFNTASAGAYNTWPISGALAAAPADIRNVICGPWCDVYIPAGGTIEYSMQGTAPNRNFAVTWCGTRMFSCTTEWLTTQIVIYEGSGLAEVHIGHRTICATGWNSSRAIVGVRNPAGTVSTAPPLRDWTPTWVTTNEAWRFTPAGATYTVAPIVYAPIPYAASAVYWYDSTTGAYLGTGADLSVSPATGTTYMACAVGCSDTTKKYIHIGPATCFKAVANDPCIGDTIKLGAVGDSIGATYSWSGPAGFSSTQQYTYIFPSSGANAGVYHVTKFLGGVAVNVDSVLVTIHPLPVVTLGSSIALCDPLVSPLALTSNLDSLGETFAWTGPAGFTSNLQNPVVSPFDSTMQGTYSVIATTIWGCKASSSIDVWPGTSPNFVPVIKRGCYADTVYLLNTTTNASTYVWDFNDGSLTSTDIHVTHIYPIQNVYNIKLTSSNAHCTEYKVIPIDTRHTITAIFNPTPDTFCLGYPTTMVNSSVTTLGDPALGTGTPVGAAWDYGNGVTDTVWQPTYTYDASGLFQTTLTVTDSIGCTSTASKPVIVLELHISSFTDTTLCLSLPLPMTNDVTWTPVISGLVPSYLWTEYPTPNLSDINIANPTLSGFGLFIDTLTIWFPGVPGAIPGCAIRQIVRVNSVLGHVISDLTASSTILFGGSIQLNASNEVYYYWRPDDGSLDNPNISDPMATPTVTTTYTVFGLDVNGCLDSAYVTVYVDSSLYDHIPTGFSPNNDGLNDKFRIHDLKNLKLVQFSVYNRWGTEIFSTIDPETGWDGTYQGVPQDIGVYNYVLIVAHPDGTNRAYKGNVTLVR